ncbi:Peptidyl-prolyl cis-trans isomerase CWC27 like protein [Eufriesea mexicana]|uniref:Spliceosome-associated protein CWC27 homolog n=1 Tax=Eufriesea mexicana TaxID=516756 RepID=A0A310SCD5_9HYME|nr:Peptidyl-prolyl cis-trans isomerase CWC27 like protein [Eufriesea mexicana]
MYIMSNQKTREAACVSRDKDVWHRHANMRIIVEMENEDLAIVMKGFVTQGGYPTGIGESKIYGEPFKCKFHTRLHFCRRDLIAITDAGKDDNGSQFLLILNSTPDLQNKHTIFEFSPGSIIPCNEKFCYRDFNLLSFGKEAEEDEEECVILNKKFTGKENSAHDHLTGPKLSS